MGTSVIEMFEELKRLVEHEELNPAVDAESFLEESLYLIQDSIKWCKIISYLMEIGTRLPFDVIMELNKIAGWDSIEKIEDDWQAPGFNDWYKETYGIPVEEASREKEASK